MGIAAIQRHLRHRIADDVKRGEELIFRFAQVHVVAVQRDDRRCGRFERRAWLDVVQVFVDWLRFRRYVGARPVDRTG